MAPWFFISNNCLDISYTNISHTITSPTTLVWTVHSRRDVSVIPNCLRHTLVVSSKCFSRIWDTLDETKFSKSSVVQGMFYTANLSISFFFWLYPNRSFTQRSLLLLLPIWLFNIFLYRSIVQSDYFIYCCVSVSNGNVIKKMVTEWNRIKKKTDEISWNVIRKESLKNVRGHIEDKRNRKDSTSTNLSYRCTNSGWEAWQREKRC